MCKEITNSVGYIWWSNETKPEIKENKLVVLKNEEIPFVIEGQLFDGKTSYSIKYVDGQYIVNSHDVTDKDYESPNVVKEYQSHRMGGKILRFLEYWELQEEEGDLCLDMKVLKPTKIVFVGFKEEKKKL